MVEAFEPGIRRHLMRWTGIMLAASTAALGAEPGPASRIEFEGTSSRAISVEALKIIGEFPDDFEGNVRILAAALQRIRDKRYRRAVAYRLRVLRRKSGILPAPAQAFKDAEDLLARRPGDHVGHVEKLERYAEIAAGTKYEARIKLLLDEQKKRAEAAGWKRERKYKLADREDEVRAHPDRHYYNVDMLKRAIEQFFDLPEIESTRSLLAFQTEAWEVQKAELDRKLEEVRDIIGRFPKNYDENLRLLEGLRQEVAGLPHETEVKGLIASIRGEAGPQVESAAPELTEEEKLLHLVAEVMSTSGAAPDVALASRLGEKEARETTTRRKEMARLDEEIGKPRTAREFREAAGKAAVLPGGRKRAVELYERAGADKDPTQASLAWKELGELLASLHLEGYSAEIAARKAAPDSWRHALACFEKARKLDPQISDEALLLTEAGLFVGLAEHFSARKRDKRAHEYEERARQVLGPLTKSANERNRNVAQKLLNSIGASR